MAGIARLTGTVKHYDWGGYSFIPSLLDQSNETQQPFAEYWLGVHPQAACRLEWPDGTIQSLQEYIMANPVAALGEKVAKQFGNLPYLFKALDVKDMLSIQVHPSKAAAIRDFEEENKRGIPLDSPQRNYKDNNHKPELMLAMGEFWLLHGFRPEAEMMEILTQVQELNFLLPVYEKGGYQALYREVMEMPQEKVNAQLQPLLGRIVPLFNTGKLKKSEPDYWAAKAALSFSQPDKTDRGIFSIYLFNLVKAQKGEAVFQDAGVPHAYLEGQNIEIMASSDNVLRGGLTSKHIDVKELLKHVKCEATHPQILTGENRGKEKRYQTPAPDFQLSAIELAKGESLSLDINTADILLLAKGRLILQEGELSVLLQKGEPSAIAFPGAAAVLKAEENSLLFRASVP